MLLFYGMLLHHEYFSGFLLLLNHNLLILSLVLLEVGQCTLDPRELVAIQKVANAAVFLGLGLQNTWLSPISLFDLLFNAATLRDSWCLLLVLDDRLVLCDVRLGSGGLWCHDNIRIIFRLGLLRAAFFERVICLCFARWKHVLVPTLMAVCLGWHDADRVNYVLLSGVYFITCWWAVDRTAVVVLQYYISQCLFIKVSRFWDCLLG